MGAIVDVVLLDQDEITLLKNRYPSCVLINQSKNNRRIQEYRVIIPGEDQYDDSYYNFLFDNSIAMSSRNFQSRFEFDDCFRMRMRDRADANPRRMKRTVGEQETPSSAMGS